MRKIVVTGGPCAGKTTGLVKIVERLSGLGYHVIVVPEVARLIFESAGRPRDCYATDFIPCQKAIMQLILSMENTLATLGGEKSVMIMDRGALDSKAFTPPNIWQALLSDLKLNEFELLHRYDAVIHMVTTADGAPEAYAMDKIRTETADEAVFIDKKLQSSYLGHGHLKIIDNSTDFTAKIRRVTEEICRILGEPEPLELERRFIIGKNVSFPTNVDYNRTEIEQIYLLSESPDERRLRKRSWNGHSTYTYTLKRELEPGKKIEKESFVTAQEYLILSREADPTRGVLTKNRYCFVHNKRCYELDEFRGMLDGIRILEVEVEDLKQPVEIPEWLGAAFEITGDPRFGNYGLAQRSITKSA